MNLLLKHPRYGWSKLLLILGLLASSHSSRAESADPRLAGYRTPPGWKVSIAATEPLVVNPVTMTFGLDGRLYVVEWTAGRGPNDHIKVLTDTDGDGTFDKAAIYMDGLDLPAGVLFWDDWTYVTLDHDVVRFKDKDGDGKFEVREVIASGFGNDDSHHRVSGMTMGPDGWIYLTTGDSDAHAKGSDGSTATVLRCGGVFRCKPDGSHMENVAFGMRNPWGNVAFDDEFRMFHTDNDNEGAEGFTGCRILHVVEGGDYGWRLREGARCCQPDYERATWNGGRPGRLGWVAETGRGAPAGLCILNSAAFPPSTRNLLVYPDVFRKLVRAYKLKPAGATFTVAEEFELLASDDPLFRPDDAEIGPDGALYILDWRTDSGGAGQLSGNGKTGRIYRMTWEGTEKEPGRKTLAQDRFASLRTMKSDNLINTLSSDDYLSRREASLELIRRGERFEAILQANMDKDAVARIEQLRQQLKILILGVGEPASTAARRHAVMVQVSYAPGDGLSKEACAVVSGPMDSALVPLGFELTARFSKPDDASSCGGLLLKWAAPFGPLGAPQTRALAVALGQFNKVRRALPDEVTDFHVVLQRFQEQFFKMMDQSKVEKWTAERINQEIKNQSLILTKLINREMVASALIEMAVKARNADPFLRDGITRGLERLGPLGLEKVVDSIAIGDPQHRDAARYALQGWRTDEGLSAILAEATTIVEIPVSSRVCLFRCLRELVPGVPADRITEWLVAEPQADPAARVEAIHVLAALHQRAALAMGPIMPGLLADEHAEVRQAALALAVEFRSSEIKKGLLQVVQSPKHPANERRLALSALRSYEDKSLAPMLAELFPSLDDAGLRTELLRTLASLDFRAAAERAKGLLTSTNREERQEAIALLGQKPETALEVAQQYNAGKIPPEDFARVIEAVRPHATPELQAAMQSLLKKTLLAAPTGEEARRLREYVGRFGNPERGKALYLDSKKVGCTVCHRLEGSGGAVGPDLTRIYETLSFDKRVEAILEPSKEIKEGFGTFKVATTDGRVVNGLLLGDTAEGVALKDAQGREVRIPKKEIEEKGPEKTSLMPVGVVGNLSFNEFADLLSFLGDRKTQESLRTSSKP